MPLPPNRIARCGICERELNNVKDPRSVDCGGHCLQCMADAGDPDCAEEIRKIEAYPQIAVLDFVRLMKDFLDKRIDVHQYCRSYCELNAKRFVVSEEESKILQQAFGDADDFDEVVHLEYTISESQLRERVAASLERLKALGHPVADPAMNGPSPEHPALALQIHLLKEVDSGNLENLECPKCRQRAVSAWFTNPEPQAYRTWLICGLCDFWTHAINNSKPSSFSETRVRPDLQQKDAAILKAMRTRKE